MYPHNALHARGNMDINEERSSGTVEKYLRDVQTLNSMLTAVNAFFRFRGVGGVPSKVFENSAAAVSGIFPGTHAAGER